MFFHFSKRRSFLGFTLVELIVTLGIFAIITTIVLTRYKDFNGGIVLTNLAYEVAITWRQAQIFGISVKDTGGSGSAQFRSRYGIHLGAPTSDSNSFHLFADTVTINQRYDSGEAFETFVLKNNNVVDDFCVLPTGTPPQVAECSKAGAIDAANITFQRPNPEARIGKCLSTTCLDSGYQSAWMDIKNKNTGTCKRAMITVAGQISVVACTP